MLHTTASAEKHGFLGTHFPDAHFSVLLQQCVLFDFGTWQSDWPRSQAKKGMLGRGVFI